MEGFRRITTGKTKRRDKEKQRGEAKKDESQGKKKKKEREKSYDIRSVCGSHFFSFLVEKITE